MSPSRKVSRVTRSNGRRECLTAALERDRCRNRTRARGRSECIIPMVHASAMRSRRRLEAIREGRKAQLVCRGRSRASPRRHGVAGKRGSPCLPGTTGQRERSQPRPRASCADGDARRVAACARLKGRDMQRATHLGNSRFSATAAPSSSTTCSSTAPGAKTLSSGYV